MGFGETIGPQRRFPLGKHRFQIGLSAVVALVALRLALGCHFLYEGLWKIRHRDEFSAAPFLTQAKGPLAGLFYAMATDLDGRQRLKVVAGPDGKKMIDSAAIGDRWGRIRDGFILFYFSDQQADKNPATGRNGIATDSITRGNIETVSRKLADNARDRLDDYFRENAAEIVAYFDSLRRFKAIASAIKGPLIKSSVAGSG